MAATLEQIMEAVEGRLLTIEGLRAGAFVPSQVTPPMAVVGVPAVADYRGSLQGRLRSSLAPSITVFTSAALDRVGQRWLARFADPDGEWSIPRVISEDRTLGGLVSDILVASFEPLGIEDVGVIGYYGGRFTLALLP
jgi:hypothetical protein